MAVHSNDFQRIKQKLAERMAWSSRLGSIFRSLNEGSPVSADAESTCRTHLDLGDYTQIEEWSFLQKLSPEGRWRGTISLVMFANLLVGAEKVPKRQKSVLSFCSIVDSAELNFGKHFLRSTPQSGKKSLAYKLSLPSNSPCPGLCCFIKNKRKGEERRERQNRLSNHCLWSGNAELKLCLSLEQI